MIVRLSALKFLIKKLYLLDEKLLIGVFVLFSFILFLSGILARLISPFLKINRIINLILCFFLISYEKKLFSFKQINSINYFTNNTYKKIYKNTKIIIFNGFSISINKMMHILNGNILIFNDKVEITEFNSDSYKKIKNILNLQEDNEETCLAIFWYCIKNVIVFPDNFIILKNNFEYVSKEWKQIPMKSKVQKEPKTKKVSALAKRLEIYDKVTKTLTLKLRKANNYNQLKNLCECLQGFGITLKIEYLVGKDDFPSEYQYNITAFLKFLRIYYADQETFENFEIPTVCYKLLNYVKYLHYKISKNETNDIISSKQIERLISKSASSMDTDTFISIIFIITNIIFENKNQCNLFLSQCNKYSRYQMTCSEKLRFADKNVVECSYFKQIFDEKELEVKIPLVGAATNLSRVDDFYYFNPYQVLMTENLSENYFDKKIKNWRAMMNYDIEVSKELDSRTEILKKMVGEKKVKSIKLIPQAELKKEVLNQKKYYNKKGEDELEIKKLVKDIESNIRDLKKKGTSIEEQRNCFYKMEKSYLEKISIRNRLLFKSFLAMSNLLVFLEGIDVQTDGFDVINKSFLMNDEVYRCLIYNYDYTEKEYKVPILNFDARVLHYFSFGNYLVGIESYEEFMQLLKIEPQDGKESTELINIKINEPTFRDFLNNYTDHDEFFQKAPYI